MWFQEQKQVKRTPANDAVHAPACAHSSHTSLHTRTCVCTHAFTPAPHLALSSGAMSGCPPAPPCPAAACAASCAARLAADSRCVSQDRAADTGSRSRMVVSTLWGGEWVGMGEMGERGVTKGGGGGGGGGGVMGVRVRRLTGQSDCTNPPQLTLTTGHAL